MICRVKMQNFKQQNMEFEESFGVIPLRKRESEWEVFVVLHRGGNHWGFPKGRRHGEETPQEAAKRELKEETGLDLDRVLHDQPITDEYQFRRRGKFVRKKVQYFLSEVSGTPILQPEEILEGRWGFLKNAFEVLSFKEGKNLCTKVMELLNVV